MYRLTPEQITTNGENLGVVGVFRLSDNAFVPFAAANTDYQEYLEWLAEGNEPLPADN
jgi:hypothetical protein